MLLRMFMSCTLVLAAVSGTAAQTDALPEEIIIPEGTCTPVLLDGIFSPGEWDDAFAVELRDSITVYFKKRDGHFFLGVRKTHFASLTCDVLISGADRQIYHFHTSAQLGERVIDSTFEGSDTDYFVYGLTGDWYANEVRWDYGKSDSLSKAGMDGNEAFVQTLFPNEGFEFQFRTTKFPGDEWQFRIEIFAFPGDEQARVYPAGTSRYRTDGWTTLDLSTGE